MSLLQKKQQGAALVVAMLILALVTVFVVSMSIEYGFGVRRVTNQLVAQQAYSYLRGTEAIAHKALMMDLRNDVDDGKAVDNYGEIWAQQTPPFLLEEGSYNGRLFDLQGRFNLNSLRQEPNVAAGDPRPAVPFSVEQGIFIRLLQALGDQELPVSEADAYAITEAVVDYLDENQEPSGFHCGEDDAYYGIEGRVPHRTPNLPLASVSELRLVCNLPVRLYERLLPHVTVWPASGKSTININTASRPLLRSILVATTDVPQLQAVLGKTTYQVPPPVDDKELDNVIAHQSADGYTGLDQIKVDIQGFELWPGSPVGLHSNYFLLESEATLGDVTQFMSSVISRENGVIVTVARSTGGL